jgi:hypothetical protein
MQKKRNDDLAQIDGLEIEALTDEELELVDGGTSTTHASCTCCVAGGTLVVPPPI